MAESISDLKHGYYAAALGYTLEEAVAKSLSDLEYEFFSNPDAGGWTPPTGTNGQVLKYDANGNIVAGTDNNTTYTAASQAEIENAASTTARLVTGQRAAQAVAAYLNALPGKAAGAQLTVNAAGTGFEWVVPA